VSKYINLYEERDIDTDEFNYLLFVHTNAMTDEKLHSKAAIAAELAYRDLVIEKLENIIIKANEDRSNIDEVLGD